MRLTSLCLIDLNSFTHKFYKYLHDNKTPVQYHQVNVPVSQVWQIYFHHLELKICFFWLYETRTPWRYNTMYNIYKKNVPTCIVDKQVILGNNHLTWRRGLCFFSKKIFGFQMLLKKIFWFWWRKKKFDSEFLS